MDKHGRVMIRRRGAGRECVFLLHGLGRSLRSMSRIEDALLDAGYATANIGYPSTRMCIGGIAGEVFDAVSRDIEYFEKVSFVAHSLGAIVLRKMLDEYDIPGASAFVMIAPPNRGSSIARILRRSFLFRRLAGPAAVELGAESPSWGACIPDTGVIAGTFSINPLFSLLVDGPDDGQVSVEETMIDGMKDFITVHSSHTFIMCNKVVIREVIHFLGYKRFFRICETGG